MRTKRMDCESELENAKKVVQSRQAGILFIIRTCRRILTEIPRKILVKCGILYKILNSGSQGTINKSEQYQSITFD